ncbi:MAG: alpha/beta fold hydrolase [Deltaproteobacteria bacterium]|nr:MAG: alpha/beta fold hydrolase [Deltaproteobacteria bacterium]
MIRAATPREVVWTDDTSRLLRFRAARRKAVGTPAAPRPVVLLVPSLIERQLLFDVGPLSGSWFGIGSPRPSLAGALVDAGLDVYCVDWSPLRKGPPRRTFGWPDVVRAIGRARDAALAIGRADRATLVGYSQGATLAIVDAALHPERVAALVNIAGPIDFSHPGLASALTDARWCDADTLAALGGPPPLPLMTARLPPETFRGWVKDFYQRNDLVAGRLRVGGRVVDLTRITAPLLTVLPSHDGVCPPASALALADHVRSRVKDQLHVPGGHITFIASPTAPDALHAPLARWIAGHVTGPTATPQGATP